MAINHFKGVIKELGPHTRQADATGSVSRYTYIEFTDGQMLRNVGVVGGLDGKLDAALSDPGEIELHMLGSAQKGGLLLAVRTGGKFYAYDMAGLEGKAFTALVGVALLVLGLLLFLPPHVEAKALGLIVLAGSFAVFASGGLFMRSARKHVRALPNVIFV